MIKLKPIFLICCALFCLAPFVAAATKEPTKVLHYKTVERKGQTFELKLHVFNPPKIKKPKNLPCIVLFHSGGWASGEPSKYFSEAHHWSKRNMVAISAEYSIRKVHHGSPYDSVRDAKSAIRWIRANAKKLGIDPDRIAAGGGSAGAHVAAAAAFLTDYEPEGEDLSVSCKPDALVLRSPVFDNGPGGYAHSKFKKTWKDFSPMHNITKNAPPTIVFVGSDEAKYIRVEMAEKFRDDMKAKGNRCELHVYEGGKHGISEHRNDIKAKSQVFLESIGFIKS